MSSYEFSPEQLCAIETPGNIIVSAGAGSGKTSVMIERIIRKLEAGASLDEMLIVTFTRAAAADIRIKLAEELTVRKKAGSAAAARALELLPVCNIGTLHSYCQRLIKTHFLASGLDPAATIMEDGDSTAMLTACAAAAVRAARASGGRAANDALDMLSARKNDDIAVGTIADIVDFALSLTETESYLTSATDDDAYRQIMLDALQDERDMLTAEIERLRLDVEAIDFVTIKQAVYELVPYMDYKLDDILRTTHRKKGDARDELNNRFLALKKACIAHKARETEVKATAQAVSAPYADALKAIALDALNRYARRKAALGRIDYSDLEHGAHNVLSNEKCLAIIAAELKYVFIDEYQDVNPLQAGIAERLRKSAGAEMFLVGDIKQSIYAFRRCNPKFFAEALTDPDFTPVFLNNNYRSAGEVIEFINKVFVGVMKPDFGGADYAVDKLVCNSPDKGEAHFVVFPKREAAVADGQKAYSVKDAVREFSEPDEQALYIINEIRDYVKDGKKNRYGDVAVLFRSTNTVFCDRLARLMRENGIPCNLGKKSKIRDFPAAAALLAIARLVNNRYDDVALYTALRSPMGGFSDAELLEISTEGERAARAGGVFPEYGLKNKQYTFWQKADSYAGPLRNRLDAFFKKRARFCEKAQSMDAGELLGYIAADIDYFQYVFETGGSAAAAEALLALAAKKRCDLYTFVTEVTDAAELAVSDGGDAVTVTTIHASKGLEYGFVIVADVGHGFNTEDLRDKIITAEGGLATKVPVFETRELANSAPWLYEHGKIMKGLREEELRLFYVALTRAKHRLLVCGRPNPFNRSPETAISEYHFMANMQGEPPVFAPGQESAAQIPVPASPEVTEAVRARCELSYGSTGAYVKTCVTAIAEASEEDPASAAPVLTDDDREVESAYRPPRGKRGAAIDVRQVGTAYHRAMELIDFDAPDIEDVRARCENAELVDFEKISRAAKRMKELCAGAAFVFKERYFIADLKDKRGNDVLVQGVIDLLIADAAGNAIIVDYKTTSPDKLRSEGYRTQLRLYGEAVEKTTPLKVKAAYLYSFALDELIELD